MSYVGPKPIEIKVMDALYPKLSDKMDKNITERKTYVFETSGDRMYIRLDSARADVTNLQFGFNAVLTGCAKVVTTNDLIVLPSGMNNAEASGECYWKVKTPPGSSKGLIITVPDCPSDDTNCYLRYLRIFEGEGLNKKRVNPTYNPRNTNFNIKSEVAILEYYGCPLVSDAKIRVVHSLIREHESRSIFQNDYWQTHLEALEALNKTHGGDWPPSESKGHIPSCPPSEMTLPAKLCGSSYPKKNEPDSVRSGADGGRIGFTVELIRPAPHYPLPLISSL
ncbi:unnamed protein product [Echinostoma caproni]|uniref:CUB domain-containing protein n=1 Tax=Echinostoma caproni TaxID=27848 RepID=A0A183A7B9_9TREM|nr:unnamed protein product [Echinostoma caproni]